MNELPSLALCKESVKKKKYRKITAAVSGILERLSLSLKTHRKIFNTNRVLQKPLKGHGPAGNPPLAQAPAALHAGEAGIAAEAVLTDAVLQLSAVQLCQQRKSQLSIKYYYICTIIKYYYIYYILYFYSSGLFIWFITPPAQARSGADF